MPQTPAWHSLSEDVHHDNSECVRGLGIPAPDRMEGEGDKPLCPVCERLDQAESSLR